jgi:hypothetical protein
VDHGAAFEGLLSAMDAISRDLPLVFWCTLEVVS